MADRVRRVNYVYVMVPNRPGQGARITDELREAGVNLLAYTAFPTRGGRAQVDLIAEDLGAIRRIARRNGWRLSDARKGFLVQGDDRVGAVHNHLKKLADQKINITAADAVIAAWRRARASGRAGVWLAGDMVGILRGGARKGQRPAAAWAAEPRR